MVKAIESKPISPVVPKLEAHSRALQARRLQQQAESLSSEAQKNQKVSLKTIQKNLDKSDENRKALENLIFKIRFDFGADVENLMRDLILPELEKILDPLDEVIELTFWKGYSLRYLSLWQVSFLI